MENAVLTIYVNKENENKLKINDDLMVGRIGKVLDIDNNDISYICNFLVRQSKGKTLLPENEDWNRVLEDLKKNELVFIPSDIKTPAFREIILKFFGARIQPMNLIKKKIGKVDRWIGK